MADNYEKLWVQRNINRAAVNRATETIYQTGRALPCRVVSVSGSMVTVSFEVNSSPWTLPNIEIPKAESQWIRMPTQIGDTGMTVPADAYLGGISGLGGGVATMSPRGNLSALVFVPVAATDFVSVNTNAVCLYGPDGVVLRDSASESVVTLTPGTLVGEMQQSITLTAGTTITLTAGTSISLNAPLIELNGEITQGAGTSGSSATFIGPLTVTNNVTGAGISLQEHEHSGVEAGGSNTGPPVAGS